DGNICEAYITFVFFFQAEDGIRDFHVTGVQTCALPISELCRRFGRPSRRGRPGGLRSDGTAPRPTPPTGAGAPYAGLAPPPRVRSEERRVGKECRSGGGRGD